MITLKLASGERLPVIIDGATGIPPVLPLRWVLKKRRIGSPDTWASYLRRIAELYEWHFRQGIDFDEFVRSRRPMDLGVLGHALDEVDRGLDPQVAGHIHRDDRIEAPAATRNPRMHNRRLYLWVRFLKWVLREENWRSGRRRPPTSLERAARVDLGELLDEFVEEEREVVADGPRRSGFSDPELTAIEAVLAPDANGAFRDDVFSPETLPRLWVIYLLGRYGGLRIGEILNMHVEDIPSAASGSNDIEVQRREDDEEDPRLILPSVKRGDRTVRVPADVVADLRQFIDELRGPSRWPDLVLSTVEDLPLSYSRASDIARQLRVYAATEFERLFPGRSHTLDKFTWHRLRHTRARELLPYLVDLDDPALSGMDDFLRIFGWARQSSADPYIMDLRQDRVGDRVEQAFEHDRIHHQHGDEGEFPF